jgi:hypothetical protein
VAGGLDLYRRLLLQAFRHRCAGLGGRFRRWLISRSPLFWVVSTLLLLSLLAGRGGEEQGGGSGAEGVSFFLSGSPGRSDEAGSLPSILLPAFVAGGGVGASTLLLFELLRGVADSSTWMRFSLPLWPVIRPFCITILYHNLLLFIDIFHI